MVSKLLIIYAHPNKNGFCGEVLNQILKNVLNSGQQVFAHGLVGGRILEGDADIPHTESMEVGAVADEKALFGQGTADA